MIFSLLFQLQIRQPPDAHTTCLKLYMTGLRNNIVEV